MTPSDFRRIALSFEGSEEGSHMGATDFRVGGHIFATLASVKEGYGNLMLTVEHQAAFVQEQPGIFLPIAGGWGRMGMTHIRLAAADEDTLAGALHTAWKLRVEKNGGAGKTKTGKTKTGKTKTGKTRSASAKLAGGGTLPECDRRYTCIAVRMEVQHACYSSS
jgi:hypothetical protein